MAISNKKLKFYVEEYLRVKKLKEQYAKYEKQYKAKIVEHEKRINKGDFPIQVVTSESFIIDPIKVWMKLKSIKKFLPITSINKTAMKKHLDKKLIAEIESESEVKVSKAIRLRKKNEDN